MTEKKMTKEQQALKDNAIRLEKIKSITFVNRWVKSGLLPGFVATVLSLAVWGHHGIAKDNEKAALEEYQKKTEKVLKLKPNGLKGKKYMKDHPFEEESEEFKIMSRDAAKYIKALQEQQAALDELDKAHKNTSTSKRDSLLFAMLAGISLMFAGTRAMLEKNERPFKKYDPERILKLFLNFEHSGEYKEFESEEEAYYNAVTNFRYYMSFKEKIEDLGKIGLEILKETARYDERYAEKYLSEFNMEQTVAILQGYLSLRPDKAKEIFEKIQTLDLPEDAFDKEPRNVDWYDKQNIQQEFKDKRKREQEKYAREYANRKGRLS